MCGGGVLGRVVWQVCVVVSWVGQCDRCVWWWHLG